MNTPSVLQKELYGAYNIIYVKGEEGNKVADQASVVKFLVELANNGYIVSNIQNMLNISVNTLEKIKEQMPYIINSFNIKAFKLRSSFGSTTQLENYNINDWLKTLAGYSITYGWSDDFKAIFNIDPIEIAPNPKDHINKEGFKLPSKIKNIKIITDVKPIIKDIMGSKIPLRNQQIIILKNAPTEALQQDVKFHIKSVEALVNNILYKRGESLNIRSVDGLMRFILKNGQKDSINENYDAQIYKSQLKVFKFHLPTRLKKLIWDWIDKKAKKDPKPVVEDMLKYKSWWKRCLHHAHWCSAKKFNKRYPNARKALDLLYSNDQSWTFNSRFTIALANHDYAKAIEVASERPGMLLRNMTVFCRYIEGVQLPSTSKSEIRNIFGENNFDSNKVVRSSAKTWIMNNFENFLSTKNPNTKLLWQVVEELKSPKNQTPQYTKYVRDKIIKYSVPIPPVNSVLRDYVIGKITEYISKIKQPLNKNLGKVYLDPRLKNLAIQYSGAESTELVRGGNFLTPGSSIDIPSDVEFIRLGVAWTANEYGGSADIDLSTAIFTRNELYGFCYYGNPEEGNPLVVVSSGDVTASEKGIYSAEFVDIDIKNARKNNMKYFLSTLNVFRGTNVADYDTHLFISFLTRDKRIIAGNKITIDLSRQDYAVKLVEKFTSYIGALLDIEERKCKILAIGNKNDPQYQNITISYEDFMEAIKNMPKRLSFMEVIKPTISPNQLVSNKEEADTTIGLDDSDTINVFRNVEKFNSIVF